MDILHMDVVSLLVLSNSKLYINGIILQLFFCVFLSLNIMLVTWLIHGVNSCCFPHYTEFHHLTNYNVFIHSVLDGYVVYSFFTILKRGARTIFIHVS